MTYILRDRPDGQVEIVMSRPTVVGTMADRGMAARFVAFLKLDEPELVEEEPASFARAAADVAEADNLDLDDEPAKRPARQAQLPAVVEKPVTPARLPATVPAEMSEAEIESALTRVGAGEKLADVARDVGMSLYSLRGRWAAHCRHLQGHLAAGGQEECVLCHKPFTPSVTSPDKCARCAKGV